MFSRADKFITVAQVDPLFKTTNGAFRVLIDYIIVLGATLRARLITGNISMSPFT